MLLLVFRSETPDDSHALQAYVGRLWAANVSGSLS